MLTVLKVIGINHLSYCCTLFTHDHAAHDKPVRILHLFKGACMPTVITRPETNASKIP